MDKDTVITIAVGENCDLEAAAIRGVLEYLGFMIIFRPIGRPNDFIKILQNDSLTKLSGYLILCFHGQGGKFVMPKLAKEIYEPTEPTGNFSFAEIEKFARFNKQNIIVTGCTLGNKKLAEAFLKRNARSYVGATKYPEANSVLMFVNTLFYYISQGESYSAAFAKAQGIDEETALFVKYDNKQKT